MLFSCMWWRARSAGGATLTLSRFQRLQAHRQGCGLYIRYPVALALPLQMQPCTSNDDLNDGLIRGIFMEHTYKHCIKSMASAVRRPRVPGMRRSKGNRWAASTSSSRAHSESWSPIVHLSSHSPACIAAIGWSLSDETATCTTWWTSRGLDRCQGRA
jgi:hypothetical protein